MSAPAATPTAQAAELPSFDSSGRPYGRGLASVAARLQHAARAELDQALASRRLSGRYLAFPSGSAAQLANAYTALAAGGPFVAPDGGRVEDRSELLYVTSDIDRAVRKLWHALTDLPEPAAAHVRCALALALASQAIREAEL